MANRSSLEHVDSPEWKRILYLVDRFQKAWEKMKDVSGAIDLNDYLPAPGNALRLDALHELIKVDMEMRWRRSTPVVLDFYLDKYPELGSNRDIAPRLIYEEFRIRREYGDQANLASYQDRFPQQFADVQQLAREERTRTAGCSPSSSVAETCPRPEAAGSDRVLTVEGGYRLIQRLGSGGYGEVWRAEAPGGIEVAVKRIFRPLDHADAQRELQALELIKKLRHPFLLQTHSSWSLEDRLLIVMELADGSLLERLNECRKAGMSYIPTAELLSYFAEAAEAIDYLHGEHVIHRDIKPDNILILRRHAKVADFGLARLHEGKNPGLASTAGTPAYMAPEVWRGQASAFSDQYSLAFTYAELRLGRRLFASTSDMMELMLQHLEQAPDLSALPDAEQQVLHKAMAKDPSRRYRSCQTFVQELTRILMGPSPSSHAAGGDPDWPSAAPRARGSAEPARSVVPAASLVPAGSTHLRSAAFLSPAPSARPSVLRQPAALARILCGGLLGAIAGAILWAFLAIVCFGILRDRFFGFQDLASHIAWLSMIGGGVVGIFHTRRGRTIHRFRIMMFAAAMLGALIGASDAIVFEKAPPSNYPWPEYKLSFQYDYQLKDSHSASWVSRYSPHFSRFFLTGTYDFFALSVGAVFGLLLGAILALLANFPGKKCSWACTGAMIGAVGWSLIKASWTVVFFRSNQHVWSINSLKLDLYQVLLGALVGALLGMIVGRLEHSFAVSRAVVSREM